MFQRGTSPNLGFNSRFPMKYRAFHSIDQFNWVCWLISFMLQRGTSPNMGFNSRSRWNIELFATQIIIWWVCWFISAVFQRGTSPNMGFKSRSRLNIELFTLPTNSNESAGSYPSCFRDRSIFMGIQDQEICNGTTGYFGSLVERGHQLF